MERTRCFLFEKYNYKSFKKIRDYLTAFRKSLKIFENNLTIFEYISEHR